jgi:hypothetical protein
MVARGLDAARTGEPDERVIGSDLASAEALLRRGDPASVGRAAANVEAVLRVQERDPAHPHRGNWPRFVGERHVEDLNSAPFIVRWLMPLLYDHAERLPAGLRALADECLRLALEEIERLDVAPSYTNIALKSAFSLIVGGQWLGDDRLERLGKQRWRDWWALTVRSGAPREFNCSLYTGMNLTTLASLRRLAADPAIGREARLVEERLWLHLVTHLHRPTRQLAGPHARSYWASMTGGRDLLAQLLWRETGWSWPLEPGPYDPRPASELPPPLEIALTDYDLPAFATSWLERQSAAFPYEVRETASVDERYDLTTYLTSSYALGSASRGYATGTDVLAIEQMANSLILHYARPGQPGGWGLMYARYVVNDQHLGTLGSFPHRPRTNFFDQGRFAGVQSRNRAIALYALEPLRDTYVSSLKTVVAFQSGQSLEAVWANGRPAAVGDRLAPDDWLVVEDGAVYVAVRPLEPTGLGGEAPIVLERGPLGELWLSIYNYRGPARRLWDYAALGGPFWRGNLRAGFVVEVAERGDYPSAAAFLADLGAATIEDAVDDARRRTVVYRRPAGELAIEYDLWRSEPGRRRVDGAEYRPPAHDSPLAVQGEGGDLRVGLARLRTNRQPTWLIADELDRGRRGWTAANPLGPPTPLRLETPLGVVEAEGFGQGRIEWSEVAGEGGSVLRVDVAGVLVGLRVPDGVRVVVGGDEEGV